ncbi:MAG: hypothetical protein KF784_03435 [Fimbriimonadaceae bacterium]|nr:hypothetical protein [Fimbriimonadaceae bacterium]
MTEIDLSPGLQSTVESRVDACAERLGLLSQKGSLKSYPGCTHWHFKKPGTAGTLEATWWPKTGRLWLKIAANRKADWMSDAIEGLAAEFGHSIDE